MKSFETENYPEEPQTIFDLEPDELDFLILFRNLSLKNQKEVLKHLGIEIE